MRETMKPRLFDPSASPQGMATWIMQYSPANDAEALKLLRSHFPGRPLSLRVAALGMLYHTRPTEPARPCD